MTDHKEVIYIIKKNRLRKSGDYFSPTTKYLQLAKAFASTYVKKIRIRNEKYTFYKNALV
jgi:hypothetical protein